MIKYTSGNILSAEAEAIINSVNIVGVMGKGLALEFKKAYPDNYNEYKKVCDSKSLEIGKLHIYNTGKFLPKYIINFPTKKHWRYPSKIEYISSGLEELKKQIKKLHIQSIAIPPLGAGNGKLDWNDVKNLISEKLKDIEDCEFLIYEPGYQPKILQTKKVSPEKLTVARAMLLYLFYKYLALDYSLNMLVTQKLAYFLQRFGEPLKLRYEKGWYGPFAPNLNKVLEYINGSYINFDTNNIKPGNVIKINSNRKKEVEEYIENETSETQRNRLDKVSQLIEGFETPYSLELLATVDFILKDNPSYSTDDILSNIENWTKRKKELMKYRHIEIAHKRIKQYSDSLA